MVPMMLRVREHRGKTRAPVNAVVALSGGVTRSSDLAERYGQPVNRRIPVILKHLQQRFRTLELRKDVRRGTSVYNGVFNLLVLSEARDWITENVSQDGELDDRHIVPKDWAKDQKGLGPLIDSILNRTPLTAETNRHVINSRLPSDYLPELIKANGEVAVRASLESHLISPAAFDILLRKPQHDFEEFLAARQRTILDTIPRPAHQGASRSCATTSRARYADRRIRSCACGRSSATAWTATSAGCRPTYARRSRCGWKLPCARVRRSTAIITRLWLRSSSTSTCAAITNKTLWPEFEARFGTKEALVGRFAQLAELRNGIRHSRAVDDVTRKDGEAALLWFRQVLA